MANIYIYMHNRVMKTDIKLYFTRKTERELKYETYIARANRIMWQFAWYRFYLRLSSAQRLKPQNLF